MKRTPDPTAVDRLFAAAASSDPLACSAVARDLMASGIPSDQICDIYVPEVARRLGTDWVADEMSFSAVTIGTARLQFLLREIGPGPLDDLRWNETGGSGAVLIVVPPRADHTLGVLVLAHQLRRRGYAVKLSLGETPKELAETVKTWDFDAVFLSASLADSLDSLHDIVADIRTILNPAPPVILGGIVVEQVGRDAVCVTGVDKVTNILDEALEFCGLATSVLVT